MAAKGVFIIGSIGPKTKKELILINNVNRTKPTREKTELDRNISSTIISIKRLYALAQIACP